MRNLNKKTVKAGGFLILICIAACICFCLMQKQSDPNQIDNKNEPMIIFYTEDGKMFAGEEIKPGFVPLPQRPVPEIAGKIFIGWDKDISKVVENDIKAVTAKYLDVSHDENVFALPSAYGFESDAVTLPLKLMGRVNICGADLIINYDTELLEYIGCKNTDSQVTVKSEKNAGLIYVRFVNGQNASGEIDLTDLCFRIIDDSATQTEVAIHIKESVRIDENNEIIKCNYGVADSKIHILPSSDNSQAGVT